MTKRLVAGPLWFLATLTLYSVVSWATGAPREVGPIIGFVVASLVVLDPGGVIWPPVERAAPRRQTRVATFRVPAKPAR